MVVWDVVGTRLLTEHCVFRDALQLSTAVLGRRLLRRHFTRFSSSQNAKCNHFGQRQKHKQPPHPPPPHTHIWKQFNDVQTCTRRLYSNTQQQRGPWGCNYRGTKQHRSQTGAISLTSKLPSSPTGIKNIIIDSFLNKISKGNLKRWLLFVNVFFLLHQVSFYFHTCLCDTDHFFGD